jgi:hypothetical protein
MKRRPLLSISVVALSMGMITGAGIVNAPNACAAEEMVSFKEDILPLLKWRCASCHEPGGAGYEKSGLDLTSYAGVMKGTKFGRMVIPRGPCFAHAARQETVIELRSQHYPRLDTARRQG